MIGTPCNGPRGPLIAAFPVELRGLLAGLRVEVQDGVQSRAGLIVCLDACQISVDQVDRGGRSARHRLLQLRDGRVEQSEAGGCSVLLLGRSHYRVPRRQRHRVAADRSLWQTRMSRLAPPSHVDLQEDLIGPVAVEHAAIDRARGGNYQQVIERLEQDIISRLCR